MRPLRFNLGFVLALGTAVPVATLASVRTAHADIVDRVVAVIEDEAIFLSDVDRRIHPFEAQLSAIQNTRERDTRRQQLYRETLERMVDDRLIRRAAQRAHITVNDADVDRLIEGIARERGATAADIYEAIEHEGLTRSEYREFMESEALRLRLMNVRIRGRINITEGDVGEEYRRRVRTASDRAPFRAAHIFVAFPASPTSAQMVATLRRAEEIAARARTEDFSVLAHEVSDDTSTRDRGGDLGAIDPESDNPDEAPPPWLVNALRDLQPGQTSAPVRGENGYHVFRLINRQPVAIPALARVRDDLFNELVNREMARQQRIYLRELRQRSAVDVRL